MMSSERSLKSIFIEAQKCYEEIENTSLSSNDQKFQEQVANARDLFAQCSRMVRALGVFSSNELLEDMNTSDLRFLLVDYYEAELALKVVGADRLQILKAALGLYDSFIFTCDTHAIVSAADKAELDPNSSARQQQLRDPAKFRENKIARFKREKATKQKLAELALRMGKSPDSTDETLDDDLDRDFVLTTLDLCIQKAVESIKMARDEVDLLEKFAKETEEAGANKPGAPTDKLERVAPPNAILSKDGKPLRPFVITNKRQEFKDGVFRPGHNLPTMSIDQYLQREYERGNFLSGGTDMPERKDPDDMDNDAIDAATMKAREFDDFKDANPRGWGNRMNKG